jgi:hypothetical protein
MWKWSNLFLGTHTNAKVVKGNCIFSITMLTFLIWSAQGIKYSKRAKNIYFLESTMCSYFGHWSNENCCISAWLKLGRLVSETLFTSYANKQAFVSPSFRNRVLFQEPASQEVEGFDPKCKPRKKNLGQSCGCMFFQRSAVVTDDRRIAPERDEFAAWGRFIEH